jgi:hypothetical protein
MLGINSKNSFSRFWNHLNKIVDMQHNPFLKKDKVKKKKKLPENIKVLLLLWYLASFFY